MHSCLSPCSENDITPANIANMAALAGLRIIAVSDHNTCGNCAAVMTAARVAGITAVPAMELTTCEEVHVLCLLPSLSAADGFSDYVRARLPDIPNDPQIFGKQLLMDDTDRVTGEEPRMLVGATSIGIYDVAALVREFGGVALPAHIDRPSFSITSNLGFLDEAMGFTAAEITRNADRDTLFAMNPALGGMVTVTNSDAHSLEMIRDAEFSMELPEPTAECVIEYLRAAKA